MLSVISFLALLAIAYVMLKATSKLKRAPMSAKRAKELTYANR